MPRRKKADTLFNTYFMEKQNKTPLAKTLFILKIIGGLLLVPVLFAAFIADRVILVFLPWVNGENVQTTFHNVKYFVPVVYRVGAIGTVFLLILLLHRIF